MLEELLVAVPWHSLNTWGCFKQVDMILSVSAWMCCSMLSQHFPMCRQRKLSVLIGSLQQTLRVSVLHRRAVLPFATTSVASAIFHNHALSLSSPLHDTLSTVSPVPVLHDDELVVSLHHNIPTYVYSYTCNCLCIISGSSLAPNGKRSNLCVVVIEQHCLQHYLALGCGNCCAAKLHNNKVLPFGACADQ